MNLPLGSMFKHDGVTYKLLKYHNRSGKNGCATCVPKHIYDAYQNTRKENRDGHMYEFLHLNTEVERCQEQ